MLYGFQRYATPDDDDDNDDSLPVPFRFEEDVVRVAAGAVGLLRLRRDRLQLGEDQGQAGLPGLAEAGAG